MGGKYPKDNLKVARFIRFYCEHGEAKRAYVQAGYRDTKNAENSARKLLRTPYVKGEIAKLRSELQKQTKYGLEAAVAELDAKIIKAETSNQFQAVAKLMELKLKVHGLLVEKHEVSVPFNLVINGITTRSESPAIAVEHKEVLDGGRD